MTRQQESGRRVLLTYSAACVAISMGVIVTFAATIGVERIGQQLARFALTIVLLAVLYQGNTVVKWICVILFTVAGALAAPMILHESWVVAICGGLIAIVYLMFARELIWSANVNAFLQRKSIAAPPFDRPSDANDIPGQNVIR